MNYDLEYKQNDSDTVGAIVLHSYDEANKSATPIDLTNYTVKFIMKDIETQLHRYEIECMLGGVYKGTYKSPIMGGVTIPFTEVDTSIPGLYQGEFVISGPSRVVRNPSGDNYVSIYIWDKL